MISPKIGNVSNDFKSLVSLMLSNDPAHRPSITEIKNHPWFTADCVSKDTLKKEFDKRKVVVTQQRKIESEKKEKEKEREKKMNNTRVVKTGVYKGEKKGEVDFNEELELNLTREIGCVFEGHNNPYTVETDEIDEKALLVAVYRYFMERDTKAKKIEVNKKHFSFKVTYLFDDETAKMLEGLNVENLEVKVELKKLDENMIIEFNKLKGDKGEFYEIFDQFTENKELKF